jgi:UDP:flavonoid glycosyltransferase YjiC (YdhE family)
MVFCPRELDFPRSPASRAARSAWVGPCIDHGRAEPPFPWDAVPPDARIAYCAFGTQSSRTPIAAAHLQTIVDVFSAQDDLFLVLACPEEHRPRVPPSARGRAGRVLVVERAPQLALLRRASLAITHAGFNSLKECAALGVPMIAVPLSHDQPRNAALVEYHRLGVALDGRGELRAPALAEAIARVRGSAAIHESCARMKGAMEKARGFGDALAFLDGLIASARSEGAPAAGPRDARRKEKTTAPTAAP